MTSSADGLGIGTKITLLLCATAALATAAVGLTTYWQFSRTLVEQELKQLSALAQIKAVRFTAEMESLQSDAVFLAHTPVVQRTIRAGQAGGIDPVSKESLPQLLARMELHFSELLRAKPDYCQVRLIGVDDGGREIVRVHRTAPGGEFQIVPPAELQQKKQEPYVDATLWLADGDVHFSEINLNREHGQVANPAIPVVRAASPVYGLGGKPAGIVVINRFFQTVADELQHGLGDSHTLLVSNDQGDYLVHPDEGRTFGFDRGKSFRIQDDYAALDHVIGNMRLPSVSIVDDAPDGRRAAIGISPAFFDAQHPDHGVTVAIAAPYDDAIAETAHSRNRSLIAGAGVLLVALAVGFFLSRSVTKPLREIAIAADEFAGGRVDVPLPTDAPGEIGVVTRALRRMMSQIEASHSDLKRRAEELEQSRQSALTYLREVETARQNLAISEQATRDQAARTQSILDGATDAIVTINASGEIESFNQAAERMFGYAASEVIGQNVKMLMPAPYSQEHDQYLRNYLQSSIPKIIGIGREVVGLRADGTSFPMHLAVSEVKLGDKRLFTGIVRDITELRHTMQKLSDAHHELEQRARQIQRINLDLRRSNEELKQFAYVASHDLQEPLRKVTAFCQMLQDEYGDRLDDEARTYIQYAVDGALRMKNLMQDLLEFSRVETQGKPLAPTDADAACSEAIDNLAIAIEESGAEVTHEPLPTIHADRIQLVRLFQNLIGNAIKYRGSEPPRIHVYADEADSEWVFHVRDNGIGIDPAYHQRIFVIFQRLHARDKFSGNGIGLAICKRIVERTGGRIWVESVEGAGSDFCFAVPKQVHANYDGGMTHDPDAALVAAID